MTWLCCCSSGSVCALFCVLCLLRLPHTPSMRPCPPPAFRPSPAEEKEAVKPPQPAQASKAGKAAADRQGAHALGLLGPCARFGTRSSAAVKAEVRG